MLVFGDATRRRTPASMLDRIRQDLAEAGTAVGIVRHGLLVSALIEAGELAQGAIDAGFAARGDVDAPEPVGAALTRLATALARAVVRSWRSGLEARPDLADVAAALAGLERLDLPAELEIRQPEGFAHYALYPEAYAAAAEGLAPGPSVTVIGIRSIGTTLAAIVSAALDAPDPLTVRPVGHPFRRVLRLDPGLERSFAEAARGTVAIVDEGPGLSGSSLAAVARHLAAAGASADGVHLFPGHDGPPGPEADAGVREVWRRHPAHVRSFEAVILDAERPAHRLDHWFADLVGPPLRPLEDLAGGRWRARRFSDPADQPPALAWQERRKFLCETASGPWLLRFAGLGRVGLGRLARARALARAGFVPEPLGFRHGFLIERWHDDARSVDLRGSGRERAEMLDRVGRYLGFRAGAFPAEADRGAPLDRLFAMALHNVGEAIGPEAAARLARREPEVERLRALVWPVETDNRLHAWEWIRVGSALLKTDALDHHAGHDLVGCQDVAWDVAGAAVEFGLDATERAGLAALVEREAGRPVIPDLVALLRPLYLAFQLGYYSMAAGGGSDPESCRLLREASRYRAILADDIFGREGSGSGQ